MKGKIIQSILVIAMVPLLTGCISRTSVKSHDGQAFVTYGHFFKTDMYYCDAKSGRPECWQVQEQMQPEGAQ